MKLELEVLASTSIKRKKPWPKVIFTGEVQESLFLVDQELQRLSVLYLPSGKTKRKIPKLTPMLSNVALITHTDNGHFVGGLLNSGDIFLWHKDSDTIKYVQGLPEFKPKITGVQPVDEEQEKTYVPEPFLHISGDATRAILVLDNNKIYVWEMDPGQAFFNFNKKKKNRQTHLQGGWTSVMSATDTPLPEPSFKETSIHANFFIDEELYGLCCGLTFVYNKNEDICVSTLLIKWFDSQNVTTYSAPVFHSEWSTVKYPLISISQNAQPIRSHGAYIARMSHDGQVIAIAVNQGCSHDNKVLYVSPWTDTVVVADMRGCGAKRPVTESHRYYWVSDLIWTYNDLFVACILKQGTLCMLTRLGEPALLQSMGCSLDMGPRPFLPLHPLITVRSIDLKKSPTKSRDRQQFLSASMEEASDIKRQRFSISSHPRRPMIIFSDGYMVTILSLPGDPTCLSLIKGLCMESNHHLRKIREQERIQISLFDSLRKKQKAAHKDCKELECDHCGYRLGLVVGKKLAKKSRHSRDMGQYQFEQAPEDVLNADYESDNEGDVNPQTRDLAEGNLDFGDMDNLYSTIDYRRLGQEDGLTLPEHISRAQMALMLAWNLASSHVGLWTLEHETVVDNVADNLIQLFSVLLQSTPKVLKQLGSTVSTILEKNIQKSSPKKVNKQLVLVLNLFKSVMHTLRFDSHSRHLMVCSTKFTHSAVNMLLKNESLSLLEPRSKTLHGCYIVLNFAESTLSRIYSSINGNLPWLNGSIHHHELAQSDAYQPAVFVYTAQGRESLLTGATAMDVEQTEVKRRVLEPEASNAMEVYSNVGSGSNEGVISVELKGVKRLGIAWLILYKTAVENYKAVKEASQKDQSHKNVKSPSVSRPKAEMKKLWSLIILVETKVHSLGLNLPSRSSLQLTEAESKLVEGDTEKGQILMVKELGNAPDPKIKGTKGCRLLLSMLYNCLSQGQLRSAMELVEFLIRQKDVKKAVAMSKQDQPTKMALLSLLHQVPSKKRSLPLCTIQNSAVRHSVQSMARLMASYFSNRQMFVYPAHTPKKLPPLHVEYQIDDRIVPINREELTSKVIDDSLGEAWTTDKTLEYLLLCGALPEAVWLSHTLGDWKTAFVMAVATVHHQDMCPVLYSKKNKLQLPMDLHPESILKSKLEKMLPGHDSLNGESKDKIVIDEETNPEHLISSLNEFLLASTLCGLEILPWLLEGLTKRLKSVAKKFPALVPDSLYLPAPPVYCPQPTPTNESRIPRDVLDEIHLRREVSSLVQTMLLVLQASNTCLPAARWYVQQLLDAFAKGLKFKKDKPEEVDLDIPVLQESFLSQTSVFKDQEKHGGIHIVLESFRELSTIMWMFHARDQLSKALRKKSYTRQKMLKRTADVSKENWQVQCQNALEWARHMMPFSHYLYDADLDLSSVLFSLVIELKGDDESAKLLAEHFWYPDNVHPEIQDKMEWLLKDWKKIVLKNKPKSVSLSLYYEKACEKFERAVRRKVKTFGAYDQFVYKIDGNSSSSLELDETLYIGSRPFETEEAFMKFIDDFYAVSFSKLVDREADGQGAQQPPLLPSFTKEIEQRELNSIVHQAVSSFQRKHTTSEAMHKTADSPQMSLKGSQKRGGESPRRKVNKNKQKQTNGRAGLFRSRSYSEVRAKGDIPLFDTSPKQIKKKPSFNREGSDEWVVIDLPPITPRGDALNASRNSLNTPRNRTSTPRKGKKAGRSNLGRSSSVTDLRSGNANSNEKPLSFESGSDPLAIPVLEAWVLENMMFEKKYTKLEQVLDWLNRWSCRGNTINAFDTNNIASNKSKYMRQQSVMRIRVPTKMILYSLWQLEQTYVSHVQNHPSNLSRVSHDDTYYQSPVLNSIFDDDRKKGRSRQSNDVHHDEPVHDVVPDYSSTATRNQEYRDYQPTWSNRRDYISSPEELEKETKPKSKKKSRRSKWETELPEKKEIEVTIEREEPIVQNHRPQLQKQSKIHSESNEILQRKKKQLRMKDKSLNVILNERYVADMNTNQNNGNDDTHLTTEPNSSMNEGDSSTNRTVIAADNFGTNRNQNNSITRNRSDITDETSGDLGHGVPTEEAISRQVGKMVAQRMQEEPPGQSTDALISSLSEMIDDELKKTMETLARFDRPDEKPLEISGPLHLDTLDGGKLGMTEDFRDKTLSPPSTITPNMTLPFGGGGGHTERSLLSNNSSIADELRTVVRTELKKLIEAQHKGILTMLNSLDGEGVRPPTEQQQQQQQHHHQPHHHSTYDPFDPHGTGEKGIKPQECIVLTAQHHSSSGLSPSISKKTEHDDEYDPTLTPVSSLSSDLYTDRTPKDKPLTIKELTQEVPQDKRNGMPMHGALKELKHLENKHHDPHYHHNHNSGHHSHHNGHISHHSGHDSHHHQQSHHQQQHHLPPHQTSGKENYQPIVPEQTGQAYGAPQQNMGYGPPLLYREDHHQQQQPFGRLMNMLRQFNEEVVGSPRTEAMMQHGPPPLLGIPNTDSSNQGGPGGVRFPPIPMQAWGENRQIPQNVPPQHIPLLYPGNANVPPHLLHEYHKHDIPERDLPYMPNDHQQHQQQQPSDQPASHIPLLHANWGAQPFQNLRDQYGVPRLVPPSELIDFEQRKYNKAAYKKKLLQEKIDQKMREVSGKAETPLGVKLLRADLEPFNERDERDLEARQRRRQIKLRKPGDKKRKKSKDKHKGKDSDDTEALLSKESHTEDQDLTDDLTEELPADSQQLSPPVKEVSYPQQQQTVTLNHGYALTPGLFDEYLNKDHELGSNVDNYARAQLHAATMVKHEKQKLSPRKKNVAVETDIMIDRGTSIHKDTATDPVGEAISRYYRAKTGDTTGNILPPDIYMGLKFTGTQNSEGTSSTRGFLNVVDIDNADILNEIADSIPERQAHEIEPRAVDMQGTPIQPTTRMRGSGAVTPRSVPGSPVRGGARSASPRRPGPDRTTLDVLGQPTDAYAPTDEIIAGYRRRTGGHIKKRLMDMDQQFDAIATMTSNIEQDFKTTKVLLRTIEHMGDAILPQDEPYTSRSPKVTQRTTTPRYTDDLDVPLRPSFVKKSNRGEDDLQATTTPISSTPRTSQVIGDDGLTVEERIKEIRSSIKTDGLRWSGISDIDDIIGEVIAKGDVDATEFGFTQDDIEMLTSRALRSARHGDVVNSQELEEIFRKKSPRRRMGRTQAEREQLQEYMETKRKERTKDYMNQLHDLREKEANPFKHKAQSNMTASNKHLLESDKLRITSKNQQREDFSKQRERQATHLMRDILEDKVEDKLPAQLASPTTNRTMTLNSQRASPSSTRRISPLGKTRTLTRNTAPGQSPKMGGMRSTSASPQRRDPDHINVHPDDYLLRDSYEHLSTGPKRPTSAPSRKSRIDSAAARGRPLPMKSDRSPMMPRKSLEFSGEDQIRVIDMGDELRDITEENTSRDEKENQQPVQKPYKPKAFTQMVKMQDPKKLSKNRDRSHKPVPYVDRLSEMSMTSTQRSQGSTLAEQQKIYGSKRIPGTQKSQERTGPRTVKTYQERLHEMKQQQQQYSTPIVPRSHGARPQAVPFQPLVATKPRKSKTYADQLKQLQPPKELYRTGQSTMKTQPIRRSHGPAHKPKTYTEQLQELQPHQDTQHGRVYRGSVPQRSAMRSRPYADPYSLDNDRDSVVSPWSMDDDVKHILYNGEDASYVVPSSMHGTDFDLSQMTDQDDIPLGADYISMVEVDELMEVGSMGSGSVMSFIDWDQIDDLIADVK